MRIVIAGSRTLGGVALVAAAVAASGWAVTAVISGTAPGIDQAGEAWAAAGGLPVTRMPAAWDTYGRAAGPIRNTAMAAAADGVLVIWDGRSRGSASMIRAAQGVGVPLFIYRVTEEATP